MKNEKRSNYQLKNLVLASLFIAVSVALGRVLASVPNIELISFSVWMSTYMLERKYSTVVGVLSFTLYSLLSPYGIAPLPLLVSQALGGGLIGYFGGYFTKLKKTNLISYLLFGLIITFAYDFLTNLGGFISFSENSSTLLKYLIAGLVFSLVHIVSNGLVFMAYTPLVKRTIDRIYFTQ
ncbi:MAG: hypothetical protein KAH01_03055 [Caldisericia bacterium]|nr:hypothetical protein [Caldisericia bacterium]